MGVDMGVEPKDLDVCRKCGAAVTSTFKHRRWHEELEAALAQASGRS